MIKLSVEIKPHSETHIAGILTGLKEILRDSLSIILIITVMIIFAYAIEIDKIQDYVLRAGIYGPLVLIFFKILSLIVAPLGGSPLYPIAGAIFGFSKGFTYVLIADILGISLSFYISRKYGNRVVRFLVSKRGMKVIDDVLCHLSTTKGFVAARLIFLGFPEAVNYAAGLTNMPFGRFFFVTMLITIIPKALFVAFGVFIAERIDPFIIGGISIGAIVLASFGSWWFYKQSKKTKQLT